MQIRTRRTPHGYVANLVQLRPVPLWDETKGEDAEYQFVAQTIAESEGEAKKKLKNIWTAMYPDDESTE